MKNTDEVNFWLFGDTSVPKLAVMGIMFIAGGIAGFMIGRPRRKVLLNEDTIESLPESSFQQERNHLSDEDREYIS